MPTITDRSTRRPLLEIARLGHGTLECVDIVKTRRFYEEVLGLDVVQTSPRSLMIRLGTDHAYAVVETGHERAEPSFLTHNGLEVPTDRDVDACLAVLEQIKDEYGIKKLNQAHRTHGDYSFYFLDLDNNWWEIVASEPGGYSNDFGDPDRDLTGRHEVMQLGQKLATFHTHDPNVRARLATL